MYVGGYIWILLGIISYGMNIKITKNKGPVIFVMSMLFPILTTVFFLIHLDKFREVNERGIK